MIPLIIHPVVGDINPARLSEPGRQDGLVEFTDGTHGVRSKTPILKPLGLTAREKALLLVYRDGSPLYLLLEK